MSDKSGYLGNPNLKAVGVKIDFTEEQIQEYIKCAKDPAYFVKKYISHLFRKLLFVPLK